MGVLGMSFVQPRLMMLGQNVHCIFSKEVCAQFSHKANNTQLMSRKLRHFNFFRGLVDTLRFSCHLDLLSLTRALPQTRVLPSTVKMLLSGTSLLCYNLDVIAAFLKEVGLS